MGCRTGMSTHPRERITYWQGKEDYSHAAVLASGLTYAEARERMCAEAAEHGCLETPLAPHSPGRIWSVFRLWQVR